MDKYILDTSILLRGSQPPPGVWTTTPEADAEITAGGKDAKRYAMWKEAGLRIRSARTEHRDRIEETAMAAGNLGRLSDADLSLLALAAETKEILLTDDHTMLDIASRLGLSARPMRSDGIEKTMDFKPRCLGCGKWFDSKPGPDCPICGSAVEDKPVP